MNAEQARLLQGLIDSTSQETRLRFATAAREHPDGLIRIPRSRVVAASYEPFVSALGNTLGIHLNLEVRFGQAGFYNLTPNVFPLYGNSQWRGAISMKVLDAQVSPMPPAVADSPVDGIADVLRYGGAAHYEGNVEYQVTFDLVPNYVIRNADGNRYCLYTEGVRSGSRAAVWDAIQQSADAVKYRIDVASLDFAGEASALPPERTYFDGFLREGARDCGPTPNIHF